MHGCFCLDVYTNRRSRPQQQPATIRPYTLLSRPVNRRCTEISCLLPPLHSPDHHRLVVSLLELLRNQHKQLVKVGGLAGSSSHAAGCARAGTAGGG